MSTSSTHVRQCSDYEYFFPILYVLVVKFIFCRCPDTDWHSPPCQSGVWAGFESYPVGSPIPWPSATPPQGYLLMNSTSRFPVPGILSLPVLIPGCKLPDLRGVFYPWLG